MKKLIDYNSYRCILYAYQGENFNQSYNEACFAGIRDYINHEIKEFYIADFDREETIQFVPSLISIINEITPCQLVEINQTRYIKITLLKTYDQTLALCNFIRNLWYSPEPEYPKYNEKISFNQTYSFEFFKALKRNKSREPFKKLTEANKIACTKIKFRNNPGHCNVNKGESLKIKTKTDLLNYKGCYLAQFFTQ